MAQCRHLPSRRAALIGSGALFAWTQLPKLARAEGRDPRLLIIVLRGALDGLGAVAPVGDPDWIGLRGERALVLNGKTPALALDSFFALNPAMPNLYRLFQAQQAAIVHATATPYRERSHFDGQDVLESGFAKPGAFDSGWLNRALSALASGGSVDPSGARALAVGPVTPLVVRGRAPVMSWAPQLVVPANEDTRAPVGALSAHRSPAGPGIGSSNPPGGAQPSRRHGACERANAIAAGRHRARARLFRRGRGHVRPLSRPPGWTARRRHGLCRLGHPCQR